MIEPVLAFLVVLALHAVATRLPPTRQTVPKLVAIGGAVGFALMLWLVLLYGVSIVTCAGLLFYALMIELYVFCFTLTMNSVSVRLLILLRDGPREVDALARHADRESLVERRAETLVANGFLEGGLSDPRLTAKGRRTLRSFQRLRDYLRPLP